MSQTSYGNQAAAFAGMLYDLNLDAEIGTKIQAEASAGMPFGIMVAKGTADDDAILMVDANSVPVGVLLHSHAYSQAGTGSELDSTGVLPKAVLSVLRKGRCWVTVEENVNAGDTAFVRHTAGAGGSQKGAFRKSADTASAIKVRGAVYRSTATTGNLAILDLDMDNYDAVVGVTGY